MEDVKINNFLREDGVVSDTSDIIPEEDLFVEEPFEIIEISNSDMYISMFSGDSDEDCSDNANGKTFLKNNISENNLSNQIVDNDISYSNFTYGQIIEDCNKSSNFNEYSSFFSDEEVDDSLECNEMIFDFDNGHIENVTAEMKTNQKKENETNIHKRKRRLFSQKSWIGSEDYIKLSQYYD